MRIESIHQKEILVTLDYKWNNLSSDFIQWERVHRNNRYFFMLWVTGPKAQSSIKSHTEVYNFCRYTFSNKNVIWRVFLFKLVVASPLGKRTISVVPVTFLYTWTWFCVPARQTGQSRSHGILNWAEDMETSCPTGHGEKATFLVHHCNHHSSWLVRRSLASLMEKLHDRPNLFS